MSMLMLQIGNMCTSFADLIITFPAVNDGLERIWTEAVLEYLKKGIMPPLAWKSCWEELPISRPKSNLEPFKYEACQLVTQLWHFQISICPNINKMCIESECLNNSLYSRRINIFCVIICLIKMFGQSKAPAALTLTHFSL